MWFYQKWGASEPEGLAVCVRRAQFELVRFRGLTADCLIQIISCVLGRSSCPCCLVPGPRWLRPCVVVWAWQGKCLGLWTWLLKKGTTRPPARPWKLGKNSIFLMIPHRVRVQLHIVDRGGQERPPWEGEVKANTKGRRISQQVRKGVLEELKSFSRSKKKLWMWLRKSNYIFLSLLTGI